MSGLTIQMIDPSTVLQWVKDGKAFVVDVREPHEFASYRIEGAISNPLSRFNPNFLPAEGLEDGKELVFHCHSGVRCGHAAEMMRLSGFKGTLNRMAGGIVGWHQAGGPLVQD
ncbi:MAG: rhodanese-like domain-containing protein [Rhodospirillum sp.]|nr:rhodanese-like domain-containing protein [Rhodospirillum sp.]MCF8491604.1 rhodanese-like domain-containing protein [Rhodospirillum sp.]MCF8499513.1 rhodanese-like domain-containing protein [Rhodospirillum sp.]